MATVSEPTEAEVTEYAKQLGIDAADESDRLLMWIPYQRLKHQAVRAPAIATPPRPSEKLRSLQRAAGSHDSEAVSPLDSPTSSMDGSLALLMSGDWPDNATMVENEAELRTAVQGSTLDGKLTVVVRGGARIELRSALEISRSVRLVGEGSGSPRSGSPRAVVGAATIVGPEGEDGEGIGLKGDMISVKAPPRVKVTVEVEGLRIEGRGARHDFTLGCADGAKLTATRCELVGNRVKVLGEDSHVELYQCQLTGSKGDGICVYDGASAMIDGGAILDGDGSGMVVDGAGATLTARGATVKGNAMFGADVGVGAVAKFELGCVVEGNREGNYATFKEGMRSTRGRIEGVDKSLIEKM